MKPKLTIRSICAVALVGCTGAASALSLGAVSGATVVGRPLELSAPIRFDDTAQASGSACVNVELLYGDKAVDDSQVRVSVSTDGTQQVARISSPVLVDEPVITLVLRAGCGRQSTRRYVLFAEAPRQEPILLGAASSLALTSANPGAGEASWPAAAPSRGMRMPSVASKPVAARPDRPAPERRVVALASTLQAPRAGKLQLAVWEPGLERSPWLRVSTELRSAPSADAAHRAAATALWRALNAQPQDLLRTADRLRGLEGEVSSLRGLAARHRSEISSARDSLQATQSRRYSNLALAVGLALVAGAGAALFWHRSRRAATLAPYASWYPAAEPHGDAVVQEEPEAPRAVVAAPVATPAPTVQRAAATQPAILARHEPPEPLSGVPLEFTLPPVVPAQVPVQAEHSTQGSKVDALHGAQQQSEFFASLGQVDEAVAVLSGYLEETREKPVLAFLELFHIYHGLGRRVEYEDLQSTFRQTFGMDVLSFSEFSNERRELETFPVAVSRIAASWPSQSSLDLIEDLLFKRPAAARELLSLDAYRELIWLYSLGQEIVYSTGMPAGLQLMGDTNLPNDHFILPWAFGSEEGPPELSLDRLNDIDVAPGLSGFGVDIDLSAGSGEALQQSRTDERAQAGRAAAPSPAEAAVPEGGNAFDAAMEFQSRK